MIEEKACGAVIFFRTDDELLYFLVKQKEKSGGHWGFAKGRTEDEDKTDIGTARREINEETKIDVEFIEGFEEEIVYLKFEEIPKTVMFFLAKSKSKHYKLRTNELAEGGWFNYDAAIDMLTYQDTKEVLRKAHRFIQKNA